MDRVRRRVRGRVGRPHANRSGRLPGEYHAWFTIFAASSLALWAVAAIAVFVGNCAGKLLDPKLTQKVAAVVFTVVGVC